MARGTSLRNIRVADPLWLAARAVAEERGETVSDIVREALEEYVSRHSKHHR
jgi:antitoxin component of RelBE/YafQ-DinJ toxin-antitoxin module